MLSDTETRRKPNMKENEPAINQKRKRTKVNESRVQRINSRKSPEQGKEIVRKTDSGEKEISNYRERWRKRASERETYR